MNVGVRMFCCVWFGCIGKRIGWYVVVFIVGYCGRCIGELYVIVFGILKWSLCIVL